MRFPSIISSAVLAAVVCFLFVLFVGHNDINYTDRVIELVADQTGENVRDIERGTRLGDLNFDERDLDELVRRINESTSLEITVAELKGLSAASPSWKRLRLHDIASLVTSKVLDKREVQCPENILKGRLRGKKD
jgi:hypothetical protein